MEKRNDLCGIYCIKNKTTEQMYIGQSTCIHHRWKQHRWRLNHHQHPNSKLQLDWDKYGKDDFEFIVLELVNSDELLNKEIEYVKKYDSFENGYNMSPGGDNGQNSPTIKVYQYDLDGNYMREWKSGSEASRYYGLARYAVSEAIRSGESRGGYQWSLEKHNGISPYKRTNQYSVEKRDIDGNLINTYKSIAEIVNTYNYNRATFDYVVNKKKNHFYDGYVWIRK